MKFIKNKGFTLIELLVTIAVLGILVLLGAPRLTSYVQEAQLTRIQHDVKVMEQEISNVLTTDNNFNEWQNNGKDLGRVIMRKELYEKQGVAKSIDWEHLSAKWLRADKGVKQLANKDNELSVGGDLIELDDKYSTYKIIPKEYARKINTKLKGTFYVNPLGKVYYEHDKSLGKDIEKESLACVAPSTLGYEFEIISDLGTITGWNGNATHLVIPAAFKMSDGDKEWCEPVRVIGAGAFQNGTFKKVTIPQSVETIEDEAFQGGELIEIKIPHSVITIGDNAFSGNPTTSSGGNGGSGGSSSSVTVKGSSDGRNISDSAFGGLNPNYSPVTDKDLGVITKDNGGKTVSIVGKTATSDSSSSNSRDYSNTVINIPKELEINGEILPVTEIEKGAFQGSGLIDVIMPEGLLYIHDYAFAGNQLIRAIIPNSVIEIGNYAFAYNEIESKPTIDPINILESKFTGDFGYVNNDGNISQPVSTIDLKDHIFIISSMGNHVIEDIGANPEQSEDNNDEDGSGEQEYPTATSQTHFDYIINGGNATITKYKGTDKNVVIPEYIIVSGIKHPVTIIDKFAFYAGTINSWRPTGIKLESVQFPDSIETIGTRSFQDNSLKNVKFGSGIKTISSGAFWGNKLTRVSLPEGLKIISNISFVGNELEEVSIPNSVEIIEYMAFYDNNIKNVSIPDNVKSIGTNAFRYNNLSSVQIPRGLIYTATGEYRTFDTNVVVRTR